MNIFFDIIVDKSELEYFRTLEPNYRIEYLLDIYDSQLKLQSDPNINLTEFFDVIHEDLDTSGDVDPDDASLIYELTNDPDYHRVDVIIDTEHILIESDSLKAVRYTKYRFAENGFIIIRDKKAEKMYKNNKTTRYLRIFKIVDKHSPICLN